MKGSTGTDATPIVVTMTTVGITLVFAVAGAAWRVGMRLGTGEDTVACCDLRSEVRQTNDKLDRILERLPQTVS